MLDKRFLIIIGCVLTTLFVSEWLLPDSDINDTITFTLAVGMGALVFWLTRAKMSVKEKEIRSKIDQLKSEGQALKYEQEVAMTTHDLRILRQKKFIYTLVLTFAMLLFVSIALLVIQTLVELESKIFIEVGAAMLLVLLFGYVIRIALKKNEDVRKKGTKTVVRGIVTDKRIEGDDTDTYVLEIENIAIQVNKKGYSKYQVGDGVEIHVLKNYYNTLLYETKIESMNLK